MNKFSLNYCKPHKPDLNVLGEQFQITMHDSPSGVEYHPYRIQDLQLYNPIYKRIFDMNSTNFDRISLNHPYHIHDLHHVSDVTKSEIYERDVFVKFSPLLDPYRYMVGKYSADDAKIRTLPRLDSTEDVVHSKMLNYHNASYVDSFFCYLSGMFLHSHKFIHGVNYYGSYLGVQDKFRVSITDDIEFLRNSRFFNENIGKLFVVEDVEHVMDGLHTLAGSRQNKNRLCLEDVGEIDLGCDTLPDNASPDNASLKAAEINTIADVEIVYTKTTLSTLSSSSCSSDSELNYSSSDSGSHSDSDSGSHSHSDSGSHSDSDSGSHSEDGSHSDSGSDFSDEDEIYGYIHNFPIQMICMEKCDGTMDELFVNDKIAPDNAAGYLFQIIMNLLVYQKAFHFTHNDLHTNNVMYVNTDIPFLYYKYAGLTYKVPTNGRIMKIIDFGRGIYKFNGKTYCSDSFASEGDAATQYNIEPFFNDKRPRLEPNNSFDLCRLGSSIFDFVMDIDLEPDEMDDLQKTIARWCMDDNGKNILYKKNGEERYPSFKLYKMIARNVHHHTPESQLAEPYFNQFLSSDVQDAEIFDIDQIPSYV